MPRVYSFDELKIEKDVIGATFERFTLEINSRLINNQGMVMIEQLEDSIQIALNCVKMSGQQKNVADAFYDTYIGCWHEYGSEMAEDMAFAILSDFMEGIDGDNITWVL